MERQTEEVESQRDHIEETGRALVVADTRLGEPEEKQQGRRKEMKEPQEN